VKSIKLEHKSPSFRIFIILLKYVDTTHIFPEVNWFFDHLNVKELEEG
jgi:hypothetical protein